MNVRLQADFLWKIKYTSWKVNECEDSRGFVENGLKTYSIMGNKMIGFLKNMYVFKTQ